MDFQMTKMYPMGSYMLLHASGFIYPVKKWNQNQKEVRRKGSKKRIARKEAHIGKLASEVYAPRQELIIACSYSALVNLLRQHNTYI
jgi:hypothetical protein